jgi:hypothetical protein
MLNYPLLLLLLLLLKVIVNAHAHRMIKESWEPFTFNTFIHLLHICVSYDNHDPESILSQYICITFNQEAKQ